MEFHLLIVELVKLKTEKNYNMNYSEIETESRKHVPTDPAVYANISDNDLFLFGFCSGVTSPVAEKYNNEKYSHAGICMMLDPFTPEERFKTLSNGTIELFSCPVDASEYGNYLIKQKVCKSFILFKKI